MLMVQDISQGQKVMRRFEIVEATSLYKFVVLVDTSTLKVGMKLTLLKKLSPQE